VPLPPGPRAPALLQTWRFLRDPYGFAAECARRFGDRFTWRLAGGRALVIVSGPPAVRDIFAAPAERLAGGAGRFVFRPFVEDGSLLTTSGPPHAEARRALAPSLHGAPARALAPTIAAATARALARLPAGRPVRVAAVPLFEAIALEVILRALFGLDDPARIDAAAHVLGAYTAAVTPLTLASPLFRLDLGPSSTGGRLRRARAAVERLLEDLAPRAAGPARGQLLTLLLTGHETVATALAWATYWILATPGVRERVVADLHAVGAADDPGAAAAAADAARAPYLDAVCRETLRIRPVVPGLDRLAVAPCTIGGLAVEPGTYVGLSFFLEHHRPETYPSPEAFRPERFLERTFTPFEFMPFGGGTRRCLGDALALIEMRVALAALLAGVDDLTLATPGPVRPVRRNVTVGPSRLRVRLRSRRGGRARGGRPPRP